MSDLCPKCGHKHIIKSGKIEGEQRWKCKRCRYQFTRVTPRGRPLWQKSLVVFLYCQGVPMATLAAIFKVQASTILKWIRLYSDYHKPESAADVVIMELEEMLGYMASDRKRYKTGKLWIALQDESLGHNTGFAIARRKKPKP